MVLRSLALMTAPARAILMCSTATTLTSLPSISKLEPTLKSLVESMQVLHGEDVAAAAEAADDADGGAGGDAPMPELLAGEEVGEVHLHHRYRVDGPDAVGEGDRGVGQAGRVQDDPDRARPLPLQVVDERPLVVAL